MIVGPIHGIDREPVESSNILALGYDFHTQTLAIEFKSGDVFHYAAVPVAVAAELGGALSKGQFYAAHIRGKFSSTLMTGICEVCAERGVVGHPCPACADWGRFGTIRERLRRRLTEQEKALAAKEGKASGETIDLRAQARELSRAGEADAGRAADVRPGAPAARAARGEKARRGQRRGHD